MMTFSADLSERKRILKEYCKSQKKWRVKYTIRVLLLSIATLFFAAGLTSAIYFGIFTGGGAFFLVAGIFLSIIPFFVGISLKNTSNYKCGMPYSSYANGTLVINDEELQYIFWCVGPHEPAAYSSSNAVYHDDSKFIYSITKDNLESIDIKNDICYLKGNGKIVFPRGIGDINAISKIDMFDKSVKLDKFVKRKNKEFSFLLAFEENNVEELLKNWRV